MRQTVAAIAFYGSGFWTLSIDLSVVRICLKCFCREMRGPRSSERSTMFYRHRRATTSGSMSGGTLWGWTYGPAQAWHGHAARRPWSPAAVAMSGGACCGGSVCKTRQPKGSGISLGSNFGRLGRGLGRVARRLRRPGLVLLRVVPGSMAALARHWMRRFRDLVSHTPRREPGGCQRNAACAGGAVPFAQAGRMRTRCLATRNRRARQLKVAP